MRLYSAAAIREKNQLDSSHVWSMAFEVTIAGAPVPRRLVNYDQPITFAGLLFEPFACDVDSLEEGSAASLVHLRLTLQNVTQDVQSMLENYWAPVVDPDWRVTVWEIDCTVPDRTPFTSGAVFTVTQAATDLITAVFDLQMEGMTLGAIVPGRRFTTSSGFAGIPRR